MSAFLLGAHLDNVDRPPQSSYDRLRLMGAKVAVTLSTPDTHQNSDVYRALKAAGVERVCVRVGSEQIVDAGLWLKWANAAYSSVRGIFLDSAIDVQALNEVNLSDAAPEDLATFLSAIRAGWALPKAVRLLMTPLSMGKGGWQQYLARVLAAPGDGPLPFDGVAAHPYAGNVSELGPFLAISKPVVVTEFSHPGLSGPARASWSIAQAQGWASQGVEYAAQFIVDGQPGGAWDPGYRMTDDEARALGKRAPIEIKEKPVSLRIVDISNYQGHVDMSGWKAAGIDGVVVRLSEDGCEPDPFGPANWQQAGQLELLRAGYHLSHPNIASPAQSFTTFKNAAAAAGGMGTGDIPVHDSELAAVVDMPRWCAEWGALPLAEWGCRALFYSAPWWMGPNGLEAEGVAAQYAGLWEAFYSGSPDLMPSKVPGWDRLVMVQFTASGHVPGVNGDVDLNTFLGTREDWLAIGKPAAPVPAPADPVEDALANIFDLTLQPGPFSVLRRIDAQRAVGVVKVALGKQEAA